MKDTRRRWEAATGLRYVPGPGLLVRGRALAEDEACPTLFRFPGAEALLAFLGCRLPTLRVPGSPLVWLSARPLAHEFPSVARFGALVLLEPLRAYPVATEDPTDPDSATADSCVPTLLAPPRGRRPRPTGSCSRPASR